MQLFSHLQVTETTLQNSWIALGLCNYKTDGAYTINTNKLKWVFFEAKEPLSRMTVDFLMLHSFSRNDEGGFVLQCDIPFIENESKLLKKIILQQAEHAHNQKKALWDDIIALLFRYHSLRAKTFESFCLETLGANFEIPQQFKNLELPKFKILNSSWGIISHLLHNSYLSTFDQRGEIQSKIATLIDLFNYFCNSKDSSPPSITRYISEDHCMELIPIEIDEVAVVPLITGPLLLIFPNGDCIRIDSKTLERKLSSAKCVKLAGGVLTIDSQEETDFTRIDAFGDCVPLYYLFAGFDPVFSYLLVDPILKRLLGGCYIKLSENARIDGAAFLVPNETKDNQLFAIFVGMKDNTNANLKSLQNAIAENKEQTDPKNMYSGTLKASHENAKRTYEKLPQSLKNILFRQYVTKSVWSKLQQKMKAKTPFPPPFDHNLNAPCKVVVSQVLQNTCSKITKQKLLEMKYLRMVCNFHQVSNYSTPECDGIILVNQNVPFFKDILKNLSYQDFAASPSTIRSLCSDSPKKTENEDKVFKEIKCACRKGCNSHRCSCKKNGSLCINCKCLNCANKLKE